jgi:uncharacterized protein (DUF952 family)
VSRVYKLLDRTEWEEAQAAGVFTGSGIDLADGYIHLSSAAQAQETARLHFRGRENLVLVAVEAEALGDALKWEASRGGDLFPHLYGALATRLAGEVRDIALGPDGAPDLGTLQP